MQKPGDSRFKDTAKRDSSRDELFVVQARAVQVFNSGNLTQQDAGLAMRRAKSAVLDIGAESV